MAIHITKQQAKTLIESTQGKLFGVTFHKKDGELRHMAARLGVTKGVKGIRNRREEDEKHNLLTAYDFNADRIDNNHKGGFRRINLSEIRRIKINGVVYTTDPPEQMRLI